MIDKLRAEGLTAAQIQERLAQKKADRVAFMAKVKEGNAKLWAKLPDAAGVAKGVRKHRRSVRGKG